MISLKDYTFEKMFINEVLTDKGIKKLTQFLKSANGLYDENIDEYITVLSKYAQKSGIKQDDFNTFFNVHGISELNWGRNNSATKQFIELFSENDHLDILCDIVKNNGAKSINDISETGNIFKDYCAGWEDEAKTIASWTNSRSANAGPCEMLLKFMLKEGNSRSVGDVGIDDDEMEVKAATLKGKSGSGGHAAGQKGSIKKAASIYWYLNNNLFNMETTNSEAESLKYFQNNDGLKDFNEKLKNNKLLNDIEKISNGIVDALMFQYDFISVDGNNKKLRNVEKLRESAVKYCKEKMTSNGFSSTTDLWNLVGCIQLYLYSVIEDFDYFFAVLIDKNVENESPNNGFYMCVKNCKDSNSDLLNFNKILNYLSFKSLDSTVSSQGRTGKIIISKNNA